MKMDQPLSAPATTGYDAFIALLASEGVEYLFGNPGTTELAIMEAMGAQSAIRYVLGLQEGIVVGGGVVLDRDLGRHTAHGMDFPFVANLYNV